MLGLMGKHDPMSMSSITDVGGHPRRPSPPTRPRRRARLGLGHAARTVVLDAAGHRRRRRRAAAARRAPGRPTCSTRPTRVRHVDAVVLTGGSAYGLAAADGVMRWLEEHGRGVAMDGGVVPIVPAAVIFDLPVGGWACRPTAEFGYAAASAAADEVRDRHRRRRGRGARRRAQGRRGHRIDDARRHRRDGRRDRRGQLRRATSSTRPPGCRGWRDQIERVRAGVRRRPTDRRLRATRHAELEPAEHHDRRRRHRRGAEPGGVPAVAIAAHDGLARTIRPCSHAAGRRYRVRAGHRRRRGAARPGHARRRCRRRPADHRGRRGRGRLSWPARCWSACWPPSRSPEYRPTVTCCPERSRVRGMEGPSAGDSC